MTKNIKASTGAIQTGVPYRKMGATLCLVALFFSGLLSVKPTYAQQVNLQWTKQFGGEKWDIVSDAEFLPNNELILAGGYYDTLAFTPDTIGSVGSRDVYLAKMGADGRFLTIKNIGSKGFDYPGKIAADGESGFVTSIQYERSMEIDGRKIDTLTGRNFMVAFFSNELTLGNYVTLSGTQRLQLTDVALAPDGDFYFSGWFTDTLRFEQQIYKAENSSDLFVGKVSKKGEVKFFKHLKGVGANTLVDIEVTANNKVYLTGISENGACFGTKHQAVLLEKGKEHFYVAELNSSCDVQWVAYPSNSHEIAPVAMTMKDEDIWVVCKAKYVLSSANGEKADTFLNDEMVLYQIDKKGQSRQCIIEGSGRDNPKDIHVSGDQLILTGTYSDSLKLENGVLTSPGRGSDVFISAISDEGKLLGGQVILGGHADFPCAFAVNETAVVVAGEFNGSMMVEGETLKSVGKEDIFVARFENCGGRFPLNVTITDKQKSAENCWQLDAGSGFVAYSWNGGVSSNRVYNAYEQGVYEVSVIDDKGCVYTSEVVLGQDKSTELANNGQPGSNGLSGRFKLYPTISNSEVFWEPNTTWEPSAFTVKVYDATGRVVQSKKYDRLHYQRYKVDVSSLIMGSYQIEVKGNNFRELSKVIVTE